ncbi:glycosyltransferase family 4 protein [Agarivorans sp. MS3-6]|uniref:glycosyltransferase family 4 protein n=1 Tax=Agarivorans sp. TSD2052 TaxID=2937286 RepID=UPI00200E3F80|nr:glycosyltransferase family 4 protein [Agarivorans sp. TSD2052]UPW19199.1 glycosyltransferase family 4 protein [Agarivorans sp. TSD2052]
MNILFHHRTRGRGAEGVHIRGVVKGLRDLGHKVSILSLPGADPEEELTASAAQPEQQSASKKPAKKSLFSRLAELTKYTPEFVFELFELAFNVLAWWRLRKAVKQQNIALIYERYSLFMFASVWWAKRHNVPIVLEINDSCLVHRVRELFFQRFAKSVEQWIFSNATGLVFISSRFQQVAQDAYPNIAASVISPNAADLDQFVIDKPAAQALREKLKVEDKVVVGYVGAFVHWHGIDWFVDLIAERLKDYPNIVLLLVGDGVCYQSIKQRIESAGAGAQIIMPGRVAHDQVPTYLSAMDFGILPDSNDYGSPMKLFEFMAMGKGMVAPDFTPIEEVVADGETSWLFKANDREACVERVLSLSAQPEQQQHVGKQARAYIERERQWRHNAEQLLTLVK